MTIASGPPKSIFPVSTFHRQLDILLTNISIRRKVGQTNCPSSYHSSMYLHFNCVSCIMLHCGTSNSSYVLTKKLWKLYVQCKNFFFLDFLGHLIEVVQTACQSPDRMESLFTLYYYFCSFLTLHIFLIPFNDTSKVTDRKNMYIVLTYLCKKKLCT